MARKKNSKELLFDIIKYIVLGFFIFLFIFPIIVVFFAAFKTGDEYGSTTVLQMPKSFLHLSNFVKAFVDGNMLNGFKNVAIILVFSLFGSVMCGSMSAFIFSRFKSKVSKLANAMFLIAAVIPMITTQVATFQIISRLGLFNTRLAPIILYFGTDVMSIYIFLQFLDNVSVSLDESAIIDGANYFQIFFRIILPLLRPAIMTVLITKGIGIYNDFYTPFLYTPKESLLTVSTSLYAFKGPYSAHWEVICAGVILIIIPTLIIFLLLQKQIYNGLVAGSVKE